VNERFTATTRSASFALTLSDPQIQRLLSLRKMAELRAKYHWYEPHNANFGSPEEHATHLCDSTIRALVRKGLVDVVIADELPTCMPDVIVPTRAGELMTDLLVEANFELDPRWVPSVPRHSEDRLRLGPPFGPPEPEGQPVYDRRDPADAAFFGSFVPERTIWHARPVDA
jgi:hypothetical protein